jgi:hypothetical protein
VRLKSLEKFLGEKFFGEQKIKFDDLKFFVITNKSKSVDLPNRF